METRYTKNRFAFYVFSDIRIRKEGCHKFHKFIKSDRGNS